MNTRHILVMQPWFHRLGHEILYGINDFYTEHRAHKVEVIRLLWDWPFLTKASHWACDGFIAPIMHEDEVKLVKKLRWKCISTYNGAVWPGIPHVDADHQATGRMAALQLLGQGFETFAYIGSDALGALAQRKKRFLETIQAEGRHALAFDFSEAFHMTEAQREQWRNRLKELPKPCGVYCADDEVARLVLTLARSCGIAIPDEIALLGTQNDEGICRSINPQLSSVHLPYRQIGYEAAKMLDGWLDTGIRPDSATPLSPSHVEIRASTQSLAVEDQNLRCAIHYLREHFAEKISMPKVAAKAGLSLRNMQRRFQEQLGHTPKTELQHIRIHRVKELLRETNCTLEDIAGKTGYLSANYLCEHFRRLAGLSPGEYRKQNR